MLFIWILPKDASEAGEVWCFGKDAGMDKGVAVE